MRSAASALVAGHSASSNGFASVTAPVRRPTASSSGGFAPTPEARELVEKDARVLEDALFPWHAGYDYYNFVETPAEAEVVLPPTSYERMREIKATYDPDQLIISAYPVRPARS